MNAHDVQSFSLWRGRQWYLLLALWLVCPVLAWSQEGSGLAPGVQVVATLEGYASAWSPDGQRLAYVTQDGIWVVEAPEFRQPRRLLRKGHCAGGRCAAPQLLWSPDGQKLAFTDSRPGDGWITIWLTDADGLHVQDLLPPQLSEIFGAPGVRTVKLDTWLSPRELAFAQNVGTGAVALHKLDVESRQYWSVCVAFPAGGWYWAPTKDRLIIQGLPGAASSPDALMVVDGQHVAPAAATGPPECQAVVSLPFACDGEQAGQWYAFNDWAPDGKRLALWPRGRFLAGEGRGLQPFLPPVGQEDAALSDAEVIEGYFQRLLALELAVLPTYPYPHLLVEYAQALAHLGKVEAAEARYREALEFVRHASPQVWSDIPVVYAYAAFLRQHGRGQEAAELLASAPLIPLRGRWLTGCGPQPTGVVPCAAREGVSTPAGPEQAHGGTPAVPQPLPPLYIVTVPEQAR